MNADTFPAPDPHTATFQRHRPRLMGVAYRMLGSRADAEDAMQDAWLRWQATDADRVQTAEAWLVATVTRLCVDRLRATRTERQAYSGPWLPEPWVDRDATAPAADARAELASDLSIALLVVLERLSPDERAAFLLHDVFDSDYAEIAAVLDRSEAACRQLVHRARTQVRQDKVRFSATPDAARALLHRFMDAMRTQDHGALLALFAPDATWTPDAGGKVQAATKVVRGPRALARLASGLWRVYLRHLTVQEVQINGTPGLVLREDGTPRVALALQTDGKHIHGIYAVLNPDKLRGL
ncbi:RNA polymerase sigma factor SigJ [Acidovorax sp. NCPPB 3576]|uniref:RNA polymerase sigma factor SigJ n=1 Tax=Acidovorax sp. NCPPB 3576 TaxID=2940488 RepID=UPI00234B9D52|nr:RNA polymerase sigma factor SigJ [Acidovorax sp. NCPPB 3576]WCM90027.1 RNA polymerase sigma factor SigJ [Acidovorax sp. NCPPB 3576]